MPFEICVEVEACRTVSTDVAAVVFPFIVGSRIVSMGGFVSCGRRKRRTLGDIESGKAHRYNPGDRI
jgi:hypothetical protein